MGYMIEGYRRRQPAERSFPVFALYVLFFPQLAAGPIERPQHLLPQFHARHTFDYASAVAGLQLMAWGIFQKNVIAANLGILVDTVYAAPTHYSGPVVAFAAISFPFQILCDFAAYSDIARGAAQVLGFRLSPNFNRPFHADSMAEYWKRWHIPLSVWMRDYVFNPLCGSRPSMARIYASIAVVFLANGLWHGARWNYLISGSLHGAYRVTELFASRALSRRGWSLPPFLSQPAKLARTLLVFGLMAFAFLFFRGENLPNTLSVISSLFHGWAGSSTLENLLTAFARAGVGPGRLLLLAGLIILTQTVQSIQAVVRMRPWISAQPAWMRWSFYYAATASFVVLAPLRTSPFIYFQF